MRTWNLNQSAAAALAVALGWSSTSPSTGAEPVELPAPISLNASTPNASTHSVVSPSVAPTMEASAAPYIESVGYQGYFPEASGRTLYVFQLDGTAMRRHTPDIGTLGAVVDVDTGAVLQSVNGGSFDEQPFHAGVKMKFGVPVRGGDLAEFSWIALTSNDETQQLTIADDANTAGDPINVAAVSPFLGFNIVGGAQTYTTRMQAHNLELNYRRILRDDDRWAVSVLTGVRYLNFQESFSALNGRGQIVSDVGQPTGNTGTDQQRTQVYNNFVTWQAGAEATRILGPIGVSVYGTAGVGANIAKGNVSHVLFRDDDASMAESAGSFEDESTEASGVFSTGGTLTFQVCRGASARVGY
ncbi:MAG: hypothetical protein ACRC1K_10970, partial [Planctomycetia bacterium]